ncbi:hypothetical protein RvY_18416 [Ramazzottius varieornatus]|uniref:Uncharacterized protein n=1 Tax=Ramazzottius varieornatus TaxID=947166 RepID=A0A1D1W5N7_RAMVA|nr:hypothetical protein RvY_18416 [Ramazzottius varieornatus]
MASQGKSKVKYGLCGLLAASEGFLTKHRGNRPCQEAQRKLRDQTVILSQSSADDENRSVNPVKRFVPTIKRIPRGARITAASALLDIGRECVRKNDVKHWQKLLTFPSVAFKLSEPSSKKSFTTLVKENITGPAAAVDTTAKTQTNNTKQRKNSIDEDSQMKRRVELKLNGGDISGAVRVLASEDVIAPMSTETLEVLRK